MKKIITILVGVLVFASCSPERGYMGKAYNEPVYDPGDQGLHGFHYNRAEWLYFTGIIETSDGKKLGYEVTIFQTSYTERFTGKFVYAGHVAVSDPAIPGHFKKEIISLPATAWPVQLGTPEVTINGVSYSAEGSGFKISVDSDEIKLDLDLGISGPILPHGEDGLVTMGDGKQSGYYSYTDLTTTGTIYYNGAEHNVVSGRTWMDHQWGNFWLDGMHWDWFSVRLDGGGELMLFHFRGAGQETVRASWTYRDAAGQVRYGTDCTVSSRRTWRDDKGKATYPLDWTLTIPELGASLDVATVFDEQRFYDAITPSYWEGWCTATGTIGGKSAGGETYVELTFYND